VAGVSRRPKPLKAKTTLADVIGVDLSGVGEGDTLIYNAAQGEFQASSDFTGPDYTFSGGITAADATITGALDVGGLLSAGSINASGNITSAAAVTGLTGTFGTLSVTGNASVAGTLTITGTLSFAGFSISGSGTIAGNLTVGGTLAVTGAVTFASTLNVTGATTAGSLIVTGSAAVGGNLSVVGGIGASSVGAVTIGASDSLSAGNNLYIGGATYTANGITFEDDGSAVVLLNGTTTIFSLDSAGIIEGTGDPNGQTLANSTSGSLFLRTDGGKDRSLYVRSGGEWTPVVDLRADFEYLFLKVQAIVDALASLPQPYQVDINFDG